MQRRTVLWALTAIGALSSLAGGPARVFAAASRRYAVLPLTGPLHVVTHQMQTGSHMDSNVQDDRPALGHDLALLLAREMSAALKAADAGCAVDLLDADMPELAKNAGALSVSGRLAIAEDDAAAIAQGGTTHLLLVLPWRRPTRMQMEHNTVGSGAVEGIGLYFDNGIVVENTETGDRTPGYLGVYTYLRFALFAVDAGTTRWPLLATADVTDSRTMLKDSDNRERAEVLHALVHQVAEQHVPAALRKAGLIS